MHSEDSISPHASSTFGISAELPMHDRTRGNVQLGQAHYSYRIVSEKFCDLLDFYGASWKIISHPETYTKENRRYNFPEDKYGSLCHIAFKPPNLLRIARGWRNIAHVAWEFDKFPDPSSMRPVLPLNDYKRGLAAFEQVWVGCEFTRDVFVRAGLTNVHVVPAPIETVIPDPQLDGKPLMSEFQVARLSRKLDEQNIVCRPLSVRGHKFHFLIKDIGEETTKLTTLLARVRQSSRGRAFVAMINPHDRRKNTAKMIRAFSAFHRENPDSILILKMTSRENMFDLKHHVIGNVLFPEVHIYDAKGVYFTNDFIPEQIKSNFFSLFDFYLCASRAEGQNLPLQEAMAAGVVALSVNNTAMSDYITAENSIVIPSKPVVVSHLDNPEPSQWGLTWNDTSELEIMSALHSALNLSKEQFAVLRRNAILTINRLYSYSAVKNKMESLLGPISPTSS